MFVEVILPVPLSDTYTYFVPENLRAAVFPGSLVSVTFGRNKHYSGVIAYIHTIKPTCPYEIKPIVAVEQSSPVVRRPQLRFWEWLSQYYLCSLGEVAKAALPSGFRKEPSMGYKPKKEVFIRLASQCKTAESLRSTFDSLKRAVKQEQLLLAFIDYSRLFDQNIAEGSLPEAEISKKALLTRSGSGEAALAALINKGILESYSKEVGRLSSDDLPLSDPNRLNSLQQQAYIEILQHFREKNVCLLHGVTSSGKTEIYIHLINETLKLNRQALFLLPEIALTTQITDRLKRYFGNKMGVYHSKVSDNERLEIWNNLLHDEGFQVILGVRSSIFLPFRDLGLIIVDEEHEPGYKQQNPAPRYHARNAAIVLATMHSAKVVLGSATPSLESYFNAQTGKYGYVALNKRFEETELPTIIPVDVKELRRKKQMKSLLSPLLTEKISRLLENGEQVLLFQNRRGFAPMVVCRICDWTPKCRFCDVSLTVHKHSNRLACHYCGSTYPIPAECPECGNKDLKPRGFGTEMVEEELQRIFPEIHIDRMDFDTTREKKSFEAIISRFEQGKTQVLIGTQMISKGLDFEKVGLVGILSADSLINFPDFRAYERAYQLMSQVAGRAGRRKQQGEVILQTSNPEHPLIRQVLNHDYEGMVRLQLEERRMFRYPPFYRLIEINLKHKQTDLLQEMAAEYARMLRQSLGDRVIGPYTPPIVRVQSLYIRKILLKMEISASLNVMREAIENATTHITANRRFKYVTIQYDVDPVG
ncbi:MAG: primosomal protein N' [Dysgonamonadaceae bacterium]|jgi:primosomal protein N' (replication factor Y)|nr:primosomal protein N' [Dysgonamonadaceae bacterium]